MKFAEEIFPKGTFPSQQTDGAYLDDTLASNLNILAKKITHDMHFMGVISGHDQVRDGKSTLASHVGSYLTWKINQLHGTNITFTDKNIVMRASEIEKRSFELPQYSVVVIDEGDELTTHGMKELAVKLKTYFRKCGQLNQIIILILPSFFELPKFYALSRSHFLLDVRFEGEYERGFFRFYSPKNKKLLYLKGKKEWDYDAQRSDFEGRFFSNYCFFPDVDACTKNYKRKKREDLDSTTEDEFRTPEQIKRNVTIELFNKVHQNLPGVFVKDLAKAFGFSDRTGFKYIKKYEEEKAEKSPEPERAT